MLPMYQGNPLHPTDGTVVGDQQAGALPSLMVFGPLRYYNEVAAQSADLGATPTAQTEGGMQFYGGVLLPVIGAVGILYLLEKRRLRLRVGAGGSV